MYKIRLYYRRFLIMYNSSILNAACIFSGLNSFNTLTLTSKSYYIPPSNINLKGNSDTIEKGPLGEEFAIATTDSAFKHMLTLGSDNGQTSIALVLSF